jgi:hypothetical protein
MITTRTTFIAITIACSTAATVAFAAGAPTEPEKTYVGCLTKAGGTFDLTHVLGAEKAGGAPAIHLASSRVDLSKHVGEKVSVRGTEGTNGGQTTLTVAFLTKLTKACS